MIKIKDGKRYNTETAELVFEWCNELQGTFECREKELYLTKNGDWFVYDYGGPMTDMAKQTGSNNWSGSEDITPLDEEEVIEFLFEYNGYEAIEKYFPESVQDA